MENSKGRALVQTLVGGVRTEYAIMAEEEADNTNDASKQTKLNTHIDTRNYVEDDSIVRAVGEIVTQYNIPVSTPLKMNKTVNKSGTTHLGNGRWLIG